MVLCQWYCEVLSCAFSAFTVWVMCEEWRDIMILSMIVIVRASVVMSYVHILGHTTFVFLRFSRKLVLWTWYLCAAACKPSVCRSVNV